MKELKLIITGCKKELVTAYSVQLQNDFKSKKVSRSKCLFFIYVLYVCFLFVFFISFTYFLYPVYFLLIPFKIFETYL